MAELVLSALVCMSALVVQKQINCAAEKLIILYLTSEFVPSAVGRVAHAMHVDHNPRPRSLILEP